MRSAENLGKRQVNQPVPEKLSEVIAEVEAEAKNGLPSPGRYSILLCAADDIVWPYLPDLLAWWRGGGPAKMSREGGALRAAIGEPFTSGERARKRTSPFGSISFRN